MGDNTKIDFLIVVSGYNCAKYVEGCLNSIKSQTYKNYRVVIIDDASTDETSNEIIKHGHKDWIYFQSHSNMGTIRARDQAIKMIGFGFDVIVWLDLDDQLMSHALETLANVYQDQNILMTYGNYVTDKGEQPFNDVSIPDEIHDSNSYRKHKFMFMHLRSFKRELYFALSDSDIYDANCPIYNDANMLFCMMEMSGKNRMIGINEPLYIYNVSNPISLMNKYPHIDRKKELEYLSNIKPKNRL